MTDHNTEVLFVRRLSYYGKETVYPDCDQSRGFCKLLQQKTLTAENIETLKELGFEIKTREETL